MAMDIRSLQCFMEICDQGSMTKAAKTLFISPQGLSKLVRKLEGDFNTTLFKRTKYGLELTADGKTLYNNATQLISDFESVQSCLNKNNQRHATVVVSIGHGVQAALGLDLMSEFKLAHPDIDVKYVTHSDSIAYKLLPEAKADFGIIPGPPNCLEFKGDILASFSHVAIVRDDDVLAGCEKIDYKDLEGRRMALVSRSFMPFQNILNLLSKNNVSIEEFIEVGELLKVSQTVARSGCIGISVESETADFIYPHTVAIPFSDPNLSWDIYIVMPLDRIPSNAAIEFKNFVEEWCRSGKSEFSRYDRLLHTDL